MIFLTLCSIITIFLWCFFFKCYDESEKGAVAFGWLLALITLVTIAVFSFAFSDKPITPIDVYRGKTTLEITYKDGIAIDSVVVWKEEVK
jgi:Kef-type K+ transport system membrane component KefB